MWSFRGGMKKLGTGRIHHTGTRLIPYHFTNLMVLLVSVGAASAALAQQGEQLHVHQDQLLVRSMKMGFGVQFDPYEYSPDDAQWRVIFNRLDTMHPAFFRVMFMANLYCLQLDDHGCARYTWEDKHSTPDTQWKDLIRILDYAQQHQIPVMAGEWSWPRLPHDANVKPISGPGDYRWANIITPFLVYLIRERHYTVIHFYNYMNEPNGEWMWPGGKQGVDYEGWRAGYKNARAVFNAAGLQAIRLVGPDNSGDWEWIGRALRDVAPQTGGWEMHWYPTDDEVRRGAIYQLLREKHDLILREDPDAGSKPIYLGEAGLITGRVNGDQQPRVRTAAYGVLMADYMAQLLQAGWMGASAWDLDDAMHSVHGHPAVPDALTLKTWGFWNSEALAMGTPSDGKTRPWLRAWSLLARCFPPGSSVFEVSNPASPEGLRAVASRSNEQGQQVWSFLIINDHDEARRAVLRLPAEDRSSGWRIYQYGGDNDIQNPENLQVFTPLATPQGNASVSAAPRSVVFITNSNQFTKK